MDDRVWLETATPPVIGKETKMITGKTIKTSIARRCWFFLFIPILLSRTAHQISAEKGGINLTGKQAALFFD
jgi:hypothetical protein